MQIPGEQLFSLFFIFFDPLCLFVSRLLCVISVYHVAVLGGC